jgi:lysophospholipase L1-like esterase
MWPGSILIYMKTARIYVFGDSLVVGTYDTGGGWVDRLKCDMHELTTAAQNGSKYQLYNLGIGGETSRALAKRIEPELNARHNSEWPAICIIAIGKNDTRLINGQPYVSLQEYLQNMGDIIAKARAITQDILIIGLGPCGLERVEFKNYVYTRSRLAEYDMALTELSQHLGVPKVDVFEKLSAPDMQSLFYQDGLHLSEKGYGVLYATIKPHLMELLDLSSKTE